MPASGPISEGQRLALLHRLCEVLGEEEGRTLMESLPDVHWRDLATKDDLKVTNKAIEATTKAIEATTKAIEATTKAIEATTKAIEANKTAIEANKTAIEANKTAIEANKTAIEASEQRLRAEMHAGFASIRTEMAAEFKTLRAENKEFQGQIALQLAKQTRTNVFALMAFAVPTWGSILAFGLS